MTFLTGVNSSTAQQEETVIEEPEESPGQHIAMHKVLSSRIQALRSSPVEGRSHNGEDAFIHKQFSDMLHVVVPCGSKAPHFSVGSDLHDPSAKLFKLLDQGLSKFLENL